jgi:hypothetical protein
MIRKWLRNNLSPDAYQRLRFRIWQLRFYSPRKVASLFARRNPRVWGLPNAGGSEDLLEVLREVNVLAPTKMCRVMTKHGSDKGHGWHNYTPVYSALFSGLTAEPLRLFELGLGTNDPALTSTMGVYGRPGASLRGWREIFPRALVYGADIDHKILFEEDRIRTFYCDQLDIGTIGELWSQPELGEGMDIIIDDGLHNLEGNTTFLEASLSALRPRGFYVVEDIQRRVLPEWKTRLADSYAIQFAECDFALVEVPNGQNHDDNNLLIVRRRK